MEFLRRFIDKYDLELVDNTVVVASGECVKSKEDGYYLMASNDEADDIVELGVIQREDICLVQLTKKDAREFANKILNNLGGK